MRLPASRSAFALCDIAFPSFLIRDTYRRALLNSGLPPEGTKDSNTLFPIRPLPASSQRFAKVFPQGACKAARTSAYEGTGERRASNRADGHARSRTYGAAAQGLLLSRRHPGTSCGEDQHEHRHYELPDQCFLHQACLLPYGLMTTSRSVIEPAQGKRQSACQRWSLEDG
jgi:hypothetical protein